MIFQYCQDIWNSYVRTNNKNEVALTRKLSADDFDELSRAETKVLRDTARDFEHFKNPFDLVNWVHKYCTEWEDVGRTSRPLSYHRIFEALGKKNSSALTDRLYEFKNLQEAHLRTK